MPTSLTVGRTVTLSIRFWLFFASAVAGSAISTYLFGLRNVLADIVSLRLLRFPEPISGIKSDIWTPNTTRKQRRKLGRNSCLTVKPSTLFRPTRLVAKAFTITLKYTPDIPPVCDFQSPFMAGCVIFLSWIEPASIGAGSSRQAMSVRDLPIENACQVLATEHFSTGCYWHPSPAPDIHAVECM
ncbi:hypothetical protein B0H13DRAFT_2082082 [Mycena leptocephala]|nr:hypothetical protein B0H13DRAFT_2082082 [Mycena leptocephala]